MLSMRFGSLSILSPRAHANPAARRYLGDPWLLVQVLVLMSFGLVMMTSASVEVAASQYGDAFYHLKRQLRFMALGLVGAGIILMLPVSLWERLSVPAYIAAIAILVLVLIPGVGHEVNGSMRWLNIGITNIQASEPAKLLIVVAMAAYLSRCNFSFRHSWTGFMMPFVVILLPVGLLLMEPDFGAVVVLMLAVFGMMFLAGASLFRFLISGLIALAGAAALVFSAEYRLQRLRSFMQALSDPFAEEVVYGSGYQLAQALIAFGRGEWFGVGLGNSIQKIYFLPEAHTDFIFAIIAEELGLTAVILLVLLFGSFIVRAMMIARRNELNGRLFSAYVAYGIALLFSGQILINIAVNIGLLPTKGLTLPFLSYGGSSLIICMAMVAMLLRLDIENQRENGSRRRSQ